MTGKSRVQFMLSIIFSFHENILLYPDWYMCFQMIRLIYAAWVFSEFIQALCKNLNELAHHQTSHVGLSNTCPCMSAH